VARDREQPRGLGRAARIKTAPRAKRTLEGCLGQVLRGVAVPESVCEEAIDPPNVLVVNAREVRMVTLHGPGAHSTLGEGDIVRAERFCVRSAPETASWSRQRTAYRCINKTSIPC